MNEQNKPIITKNLTYTVVPQPAGNLSGGYTKAEADKKFNEASQKLDKADKKLIEAIKRIEKTDIILLSVVVILLVMVGTLVIDSFHINSAVYKEYSQKTESIEAMQKTNEVLLKQIQDLAEQSNQDREIIKQLLKK